MLKISERTERLSKMLIQRDMDFGHDNLIDHGVAEEPQFLVRLHSNYGVAAQTVLNLGEESKLENLRLEI